MPQYASLSDEDFAKVAIKYNMTRDIFGFSTILSLTYPSKTPKPAFLTQISDYINAKAKKYLPKGKLEGFQTIMKTKNVGLLMAERALNLPMDLVPGMHTELPDDLEFTKAQDDISDPKEFSYQYLCVLSRFTRSVSKDVKKSIMKAHETSKGDLAVFKRQKLDESAERIYYKWEDAVFEPEAAFSFEYLNTFTDVDEDGKKVTYQGNRGESETQYRIIYLIEWKKYVEKAKLLSGMVKN